MDWATVLTNAGITAAGVVLIGLFISTIKSTIANQQAAIGALKEVPSAIRQQKKAVEDQKTTVEGIVAALKETHAAEVAALKAQLSHAESLAAPNLVKQLQVMGESFSALGWPKEPPSEKQAHTAASQSGRLTRKQLYHLYWLGHDLLWHVTNSAALDKARVHLEGAGLSEFRVKGEEGNVLVLGRMLDELVEESKKDLAGPELQAHRVKVVGLKQTIPVFAQFHLLNTGLDADPPKLSAGVEIRAELDDGQVRVFTEAGHATKAP